MARSLRRIERLGIERTFAHQQKWAGMSTRYRGLEDVTLRC